MIHFLPEKLESFEGDVGDTGVVSSPFFPDKYRSFVGLDEYRYVIRNSHESGGIRLSFLYWNPLVESSLQVRKKILKFLFMILIYVY